jgi:hypothetical protein
MIWQGIYQGKYSVNALNPKSKIQNPKSKIKKREKRVESRFNNTF